MDDFVLIVTVATEGADQLEACLKNIRTYYPKAPLHVISDGEDLVRYRHITARYKAKYWLSRYYKRAECGGLWWKRFFEIGVASGRKWIIKFDPDSRFARQFKGEPKFDINGTLSGVGQKHENIQGGCQVISRTFAKRLLASKLLDSPRLREPRVFCPNDGFLRLWIPTGYFSTDFSLMYLVRKLKATYGAWTEVMSHWRGTPNNPNAKYAVIHPVKMDLDYEHVDPNVPLNIVTTCMGRLEHLKKALPTWVNEPHVTVTVVDWNCPDRVAAWLTEHYPQVKVVRKEAVSQFHLAAARNLGAKGIKGWLCFFDADLMLKPGWSTACRKQMHARRYHVPQPIHYGMTGSCIVRSDHFAAAGGYDEIIRGWGGDDVDFYMKLRQIGARPWFWPGDYAQLIQHDDKLRTQFYTEKNRRHNHRIICEYLRLKVDWIIKHWKLPDWKTRKALMDQAIRNVNDPPCSGNLVNRDELHITGGEPIAAMAVGQLTPQTLQAGIQLLQETGGWGKESQPAGLVGHIPGSTLTTLGRAAYNTHLLGEKGMNISVVNKSSLHLGMSLEQLVDLGNLYIQEVICALWPGTNARLIATKEILPHTHAIILMDDPEHNNQLGYRTRTPDGFPLTRIFVKPTMTSAKSITQVFTAEMAEFVIDPGLNRTAVHPDGSTVAYEISDPVEETSFTLAGHTVSNIVSPAYFESWHAAGSTRFDYLGLVSKPFEILEGGWLLVRPQSGKAPWNEIYGSAMKGQRTSMHFPDQRHIERKSQQQASTQHAYAQYLKAQ